jgi:hypothetical protein
MNFSNKNNQEKRRKKDQHLTGLDQRSHFKMGRESFNSNTPGNGVEPKPNTLHLTPRQWR